MKINFSIIIPIHKPNYDYLIECFGSIAPQLESNDQVVCVLNGNDKDVNDEIIKYIPTNFDIFTIEVGDVSAARNIGIKNAKNEYILFVDCDDLVALLLLNKARDLLGINNPDYITFLDTNDKDKVALDLNNTHILGKEIFLKIWQGKQNELPSSFQFRSCWDHIYKKDIITNNHIFFNEGQKIAEDTLFNFEYCLNSNIFIIDDSVMYFYRQNENGTTVKYNQEAINIVNTIVDNYSSLLEKYNISDKDYYFHFYKEILFNYLPYIFKSLIFNKYSHYKLKEKTRLLKNFRSEPIVKTAVKETSIKNATNKKHKCFLIMLKLKLYTLICLIYR